jgi:hypothetical protein
MVCLSSTAPRESSLALCYPPGPRRDAASGSEPRCERNARGALVHDTGAAHVPPSHDPHVTPPQRCVPLPAAHDHRAERAWRMGSLANTPMTPRSIRVRLALRPAPRCTRAAHVGATHVRVCAVRSVRVRRLGVRALHVLRVAHGASPPGSRPTLLRSTAFSSSASPARSR